MNPNLTPGPPEGQEPIEQLFREVFGLAEETARRITDAEVDARLDRVLRKTGHATPARPGAGSRQRPGHCPPPGR